MIVSGRGAVEPLEVGVGRKRLSDASSAAKSRSTETCSAGRGAADDDLAAHRLEASRAHEVWVEAWGELDDSLGETEPELEPEPKNELLSAASWLIRDESSRPPLVDEVGVGGRGAVAVWAPPRTSSERTPKPTTAAPAEAILRRRARRRAGARREDALEAAVDMHL